MKKTLAIALAFVMLLAAAIPAFAATATEVPDSKFTNNIALQDEYYMHYDKLIKENATQFDVYTADALYTLVGMINADANGFAGKTVSIKCDLIFNEGNAADWATTAPAYKWTVLDNFKGTFDGEGHTISGLYVKGTTNFKDSMFGRLLQDATVKNFALVNSYFESSAQYQGGVVGRINSTNVTVQNIYADIIVKNTKGADTFGKGGLIGLVSNTGNSASGKYALIEGCVFAGSIDVAAPDKADTPDVDESTTVNTYASGIVGANARYQYCNTVIRDCMNLGTVRARIAAAIAGTGSTYTIERCVNLGNVISTDVQGAPNATTGEPDPFYFDDCLVGKLQKDNTNAGEEDAVAKLNLADSYNISNKFMANYSYEVPANQTVTVITKDGVKGDAAKTVLTALDFAATDANKADWVTRANDVPMPKAIATMLAGVPNVADPSAAPSDPTPSDPTPGETTTPAETTAATTKAPETTKAAETTAAATAAATTAAEEKGGCGSTIGIASLAVLAVAGGVTFVATKKKED